MKRFKMALYLMAHYVCWPFISFMKPFKMALYLMAHYCFSVEYFPMARCLVAPSSIGPLFQSGRLSVRPSVRPSVSKFCPLNSSYSFQPIELKLDTYLRYDVYMCMLKRNFDSTIFTKVMPLFGLRNVGKNLVRTTPPTVLNRLS